MTFKFLELDEITWVTEPRKTSMRKTKSNRREKEEDEETAEILGQPREAKLLLSAGRGCRRGCKPVIPSPSEEEAASPGPRLCGLRTVGENLFEVSLLVSGYLLADTPL